MSNINGLDHTNKYMQGSVFKWTSGDSIRAGVQSGERPMLIISNNTFNYFSPVVNCVSITSILKESPVHVPIYINMDSHVQCEQIHTIPKAELVDFMGMAPPITISNVKAKLRIQFDMAADKNTEMFQAIKKILDDLNAQTEPEIFFPLSK